MFLGRRTIEIAYDINPLRVFEPNLPTCGQLNRVQSWFLTTSRLSMLNHKQSAHVADIITLLSSSLRWLIK